MGRQRSDREAVAGAFGRDSLKRAEECREADRSLGRIAQRVDRRDLPSEPPGNRPRPRIPEVRLADADYHRDRQRQMRSNLGQPVEFRLGLVNRSGVPRNPNRQFVAQAIDHVIRPGRIHQAKWCGRPLRKLRLDQSPYERGIDDRTYVDGFLGDQQTAPRMARSRSQRHWNVPTFVCRTDYLAGINVEERLLSPRRSDVTGAHRAAIGHESYAFGDFRSGSVTRSPRLTAGGEQPVAARSSAAPM